MWSVGEGESRVEGGAEGVCVGLPAHRHAAPRGWGAEGVGRVGSTPRCVGKGSVS